MSIMLDNNEEVMSNNLKRIRRSIGMSQDELARRLETTRSYISGLESGNIREPSIGRARAIAYHLGVDVETVFPIDKRLIK